MSDSYLNLNGASRFWSKIKSYVDSSRPPAIKSPNGTYTASMQNDGNFVVYNGSSAKWNTDDTITRWSHEDEDPQRLYTSSAASTVVAKSTSSWTNVQSFTVNTNGWHLVSLIQYVNLSSNATSGHIAMRITDGDSRNHDTYIGCYAIRGGGTMSMSFVGYFAANTTYYVKAINTTTVDWTINRTLGDSELMIQYLHRNT